MVTFGDMMSLLLCFFVILVALSEIKQEKFETVVRSFHQYFGEGPPGGKLPGKQPGQSGDKLNTAGAQSGERAFGGASDSRRIGGEFEVNSVKRGKLITLGGKLAFEKGKDKLLPKSALAFRRNLAPFLARRMRIIEVTGHAGPDETTDYYELSWQRARAVASALRDGGVPMTQMKLIGAGPFDTVGLEEPGGAVDARRVEIVVTEILYNPAKVR